MRGEGGRMDIRLSWNLKRIHHRNEILNYFRLSKKSWDQEPIIIELVQRIFIISEIRSIPRNKS